MLKDAYKRYHFFQFLSYALMLLILVASIFVFTIIFLRPQLEQSFYTLTRVVMQERVSKIDFLIETLGTQALELATNKSLITAASQVKIEDDFYQSPHYQTIQDLLSDVKASHSVLYDIAFKPTQYDEIIYSSGEHFTASHYEFFFRPPPSNRHYQLLTPAFYDLKENILVVGVQAPLYVKDKLIGSIMLLIKNTDFYEAIAAQTIYDEHFYVFNDTGDIFYTNDPVFLDTNQTAYKDDTLKMKLQNLALTHENKTFEMEVDESNYLFFYRYSPKHDINFVGGLNKSQEYQSQFLSLTKLALAISIPLFILLTIYTVKLRDRDRELSLFSSHLKVGHKGIFQYLSINSSNPYLNDLYHQYNALIHHIGLVSSDISEVSRDIHHYATVLNQEADTHNKMITSLSKTMMTVSDDTAKQLATIENLNTFSKSIELKFSSLINTFDFTQSQLAKISSKINVTEDSLQQNKKLNEQSHFAITHEISEVLMSFETLQQDMTYLIKMHHNIEKLIDHLSALSHHNEEMNNHFKQAIAVQNKSVLQLSKIISNLYQLSLRLNNDISKLKIPLLDVKKKV